MNLYKLTHYADLVAIPLFALAIWYFMTKPEKTTVEYVLLCFVCVGLIADLLFSWNYFFKSS